MVDRQVRAGHRAVGGRGLPRLRHPGGEERVVGQAVIESLVVAILLGMAIRTFWKPGAIWAPGISSQPSRCWSAIVLLGA